MQHFMRVKGDNLWKMLSRLPGTLESVKVEVLVAQPGSSVHGILQARTLEWGAIPFSRGSS